MSSKKKVSAKQRQEVEEYRKSVLEGRTMIKVGDRVIFDDFIHKGSGIVEGISILHDRDSDEDILSDFMSAQVTDTHIFHVWCGKNEDHKDNVVNLKATDISHVNGVKFNDWNVQ